MSNFEIKFNLTVNCVMNKALLASIDLLKHLSPGKQGKMFIATHNTHVRASAGNYSTAVSHVCLKFST